MQATQQRREIQDKIAECSSKTRILFAGVALETNDSVRGYTWEEFKKATDAAWEIDRLEQELIKKA